MFFVSVYLTIYRVILNSGYKLQGLVQNTVIIIYCIRCMGVSDEVRRKYKI